MLANPQPLSSSRTIPSFKRPQASSQQTKRPTTRDSDKQQLWIPLLQSASKGKDLTEKHLILLGGTPDQQREFLEHLNPEHLRSRNTNRGRGQRGRNNDRTIPISNKYALGYTYQEVMDADGEDVLARLNIHMLTNPSGRFAPLLKPLLSAANARHTMVVVLLDWDDPFKWAKQLRQWIRLLRKVIMGLDDETKIELEEVMNAWKEKRLGYEARTTGEAATTHEAGAGIPLGPGEWDEGLGIPLGVVCVQSEKIERLERELGWGDDQFDFVQQWLRTVLLKHGASLVYTATFDANQVRALIHNSLGIQSLLKKDVIAYNVIDRDKILVAPNWDSWGKIRILREGLEPEVISDAWSVEIQAVPEDIPDYTTPSGKTANVEDILRQASQPESAVTIFESSLPPPDNASMSTTTTTTTATTTSNQLKPTLVQAQPYQDFLHSQLLVLEQLKAEDARLNNSNNAASSSSQISSDSTRSPIKSSRIEPTSMTSSQNININVNGIDFDADEATRRLRAREEASRSTGKRDRDRDGASGSGTSISTPTPTRVTALASDSNTDNKRDHHHHTSTDKNKDTTTTKDGTNNNKPTNEALHGFFASLIKKGPAGGNSGTSRGGSGQSTPSRNHGHG